MSIDDLPQTLYDKKDGVATVTINRPDKMNAFTLEGIREMIGYFHDASADPEVGVMVLTGAGDRAFCTGGDVGDFEAFDIEADREMTAELLRLSDALRNGGKPVICRVRGYCIGAGNELNMQCDLTIASEDAVFGQVGPRMGSFPGWWATQMLPRVVGEKRAREIVYLCHRYSAQEALEMGWINRVVPAEDLDGAVREWCDELLEKSPVALRLAKMNMNFESDQLWPSVRHATEVLAFYHATPESKEGMQAFMEKRKPDFSRFRSK